MADSIWAPTAVAAMPAKPVTSASRHAAVVRITHWLTFVGFLALLLSGVEILMSHPRFYWGEAGNVNSAALFKLPFPASRATFPTSYGYVLPDQNGWSRYLHFQAAWLIVLTGLMYVIFGLVKGHFRENMLLSRAELSGRSLAAAFRRHLTLRAAGEASYNVLQRLTYLFVIFVLFPLVIWTGLAMSPAIASAFPAAVSILGGQQSARTIHFFVSVLLVLFLLVHVGMVCVSRFRNRMRAMITGRSAAERE